MTLEQEIYTFAEKRNLEAGITSAEPFWEQEKILLQENGKLKGFTEQNIQKRIIPTMTMKNAKSIIVFAMGYGYRKKIKESNDLLTGECSIAAVGEDYHVILKKYFEDLEQFLKRKVRNFECKYFVDTGPLVDRAVAVRAGLGWIGKNGSVHTVKFGSLAFLGYMMTNISLKQKEMVLGDCEGCKKCILCCPTGALSENMFHIEKCISYLTQTKTVLSSEVMRVMGKQIYGCDICQIVCPKNQKILHSFDEKETDILLEELLHCSNKAFDEKFAKTAAGWRGKKILQRNAIIALGNSKTKKALPILKQALHDERELIQQTALRAIYNLHL
ncbi:tRNA epoxyqueuosine(34) reductase QueG [Lachnospiraceae bacterium 46-61]